MVGSFLRERATSSNGNSNASIPATGNSMAVDTSVASDVLADRADALAAQSITEFLLLVPVVGELRYGALNSRRAEENLAEVERLLARCRVLDVAVATAEV
jgi:predicted nucleic acid-binding protein